MVTWLGDAGRSGSQVAIGDGLPFICTVDLRRGGFEELYNKLSQWWHGQAVWLSDNLATIERATLRAHYFHRAVEASLDEQTEPLSRRSSVDEYNVRCGLFGRSRVSRKTYSELSIDFSDSGGLARSSLTVPFLFGVVTLDDALPEGSWPYLWFV